MAERTAQVGAQDLNVLAFVPIVFLLLWSTGFIVAKYAAPHAPPLTFLVWRFAGVIVAVLPFIVLQRAPWPDGARLWMHVAVAGVLIQAAYLGGVWWAIDRGVPAGVSALIVGVQPLLTAMLAGIVGERSSARQWLGLALGFAGVVLVLMDRVTLQGAAVAPIAVNVLALLGITGGTLYQKRFCTGVDLRTASAIQFVAALVVIAPLAWALESRPIDYTFEFWAALLWSVVGISIVAMVLLLGMIRRGRATAVASLMYLTPPLTAIMAWGLFAERLGLIAWSGVIVTMLGVALVLRAPRQVR